MIANKKNHAGARERKRRLLGAGLAAALVSALFALTPTATFAAPSATVTISPVFPSQNPGVLLTGTTATSTVSYTCSNVDPVGCVNTFIDIPFNSDIQFEDDGEPSVTGRPYAWNASTRILTIDAGDVAPGASSNVDVQFTAANYVTPHAYTQILRPVLRGDNGLSATSPQQVRLDYVAQGGVSVEKDIVPPKTASPGGTIEYFISACWNDYGPGTLRPTNWTITDELDPALSWADPDTTGWNGGTNTLVLSSSDYTMEACDSGNSPIIRNFTVAVDPGTPDAYFIDNEAQLAGQYPGNVAFSDTDDVGITVRVSDIPPGYLDSTWNGAVTDDGTWAGDWRPNLPNLTMPGGAAQAIYNSSNESLYKAHFQTGANAPYSAMGISNPMPCMTNKNGQTYDMLTSGVCAEPAYNPVFVELGGVFFTYVNLGFKLNLIVVRTDGTSFNLQPYDAGGYRWRIPDNEIGNVAELRIGAPVGTPLDSVSDSDLSNALLAQDFFFATLGYLHEDMQPDEIARNNIFMGRNLTQPIIDSGINNHFNGTPGKSMDSAYTQLKIAKAHIGTTTTGFDEGPTDKYWRVRGYWAAPGPADGDLIISDLLPATTSTTLTSGTHSVQLTSPSGTDITVDAELEVIPNYSWSGQTYTLVRMVIDKDTLNTHSPAVPDTTATVEFEIPIVLSHPIGNFQNNVEATTGSPIEPACRVNHAGPVSGYDWDGIPSTTWSCISAAFLTLTPAPGSALLQLTKQVRGDENPDFVASPSVGLVNSGTGTATYRLDARNFGAASLDAIVTYDLFPRVGDTGIITGTASQPRGSTFEPTLTAVGALPAGVTIQYSQAANPCRPEVLPTNPGCANDWTSTAPNDLSTVKAIRLASSLTYATGEGFTVDLDFATPDIDQTDIAWNTIGGRARNAGTLAMLQPTEAPKVGIREVELQGLTIVKTADTDPLPSLPWNTLVNWSYLVTNIGTKTVDNIVVADDQGVTVTCPSTSLAGGDNMTCTGSGRVK